MGTMMSELMLKGPSEDEGPGVSPPLPSASVHFTTRDT